MTQDGGRLILDAYRSAARTGVTSGPNYKDLPIHAIPAIHEEVARAAARALKPNSAVLDVASGSGALCLRLQDIGFAMTGCDLVSENFRLHDTVPFVEVNLNLPFAEKFGQRFDGITATEIIEHVENPRHFLRQCFALLEPGGTLILTTPNIDSALARAIWIRTGTFRWFEASYYARDGHITPVPAFVLKAALQEAGFKTTGVSSVGQFDDPYLPWWRMHLFAWLLRKADGPGGPQGEILFVVATKPG
jgi:cyclopropane fatty-acyl-phospholipid synthase-like methyltransferase